MGRAGTLSTSMMTLCVVSALALTSCNEKTEAMTGGGESLMTVPLGTGDVTRVVNASGKIVPKDQVMVGSEVSGRVLEVLVDFNSPVQTGDVLARIDPETFENSVRQLDGRLQSAQADIRVQEASINRANVNLAQAKIVLKRKSDLYAEEAVSQAQLEEAERTVGVSEADLELAEARLESSRAEVNQIKAQLGNARANVEKTIIRSPIDGVVIDRKVDPGQTVQASFSAPELFAIAADLGQVRVEAQIVESDVAGLEAGDKAKFTVDAYPDMVIPGVVEQLRLKSQEANNIVTYVAVVAAANESGQLMPGMTANLEITTEVKSNVSRIPTVAERFRPTPDQVAQWQAETGGQEVKRSVNAPVYDRLKAIGVSESNIASVKQALERSSQPLADIIADPEKTFMHTPTKIRLEKLTLNVLKSQLSPGDFSSYNASLVSERNIREVMMWVQTADGKMKQVPAKLGLSDGAFIEVVSGLNAADKIVTGISARPKDPKRSGKRGGQRRASK